MTTTKSPSPGLRMAIDYGPLAVFFAVNFATPGLPIVRVVAAAEKYGLPIHAIGIGEGMTDLRPFDANEVSRIIAGVEGVRK